MSKIEQKGGKKYKSGDLVNCVNIKCLNFIKNERKNNPSIEKTSMFVVLSKKNNLYQISTLKDYSTNLNKIATIMNKQITMTKKRKLLKKITVPFYSVYSYELSPYIPLIKNYLSEINNTELIQSDFFAMDTHGLEFQLKPDIPLYEGQYVIMNCNPGELTSTTGYVNELSKFFKSKADILNYFRDHPYTKYCVYQNYVPDLRLKPIHAKLRTGLYRIPIQYDFDSNKKLNFLKQKFPRLHNKSKISKKVYIQDIVHHNPFLQITSEKYYTNMRKGKINLKNVINKLQKKYNTFTIVINACRKYDGTILTENNISRNFQKTKLIAPILPSNNYF